MCFGNDDPPQAPQLSAPPPPPEIMDVIDEITGVQSVVTTNAQGRKQRVTSRLPRTPEEEQRFKMGERLIATSMQNISELYKYDPRSTVDYAPIIETFANINQETAQALGQIADIGNINQEVENFKRINGALLEEKFANENRRNESNLAHSGLGKSTYAAEARAAIARNQNLARQQGELQASVYGEDLASKRLERNKQAFGLQQMGRENRLKESETAYALAKDFESDVERRRLLAIEENKGLLEIGSSVTGQDLNKAMNNKTAELSLDTFNAQAGDSMNRYNADVNRQVANHRMAMDSYNSKPPSFAESMVGVGARLGGAYIGGRLGEMGRRHESGSSGDYGTMRRKN
jgi:hypothetical protein